MHADHLARLDGSSHTTIPSNNVLVIRAHSRKSAVPLFGELKHNSGTADRHTPPIKSPTPKNETPELKRVPNGEAKRGHHAIYPRRFAVLQKKPLHAATNRHGGRPIRAQQPLILRFHGEGGG